MTNTGDQRGYNLSLADTFTSIPLRGDGKNKTVQFISASTSDGPITSTSVTTNPVTNALSVQFDDIRDLVPTEAVAIDIVVRPTDATWAVGHKIHDAATAQVNTRADGGGTWIQGSATGDTNIIPIKMLTKTANQSTGVEQANGCGELNGGRWPYSYTVVVQNNYVNTTNAVSVQDVVPDGIEYMGMASGPAPALSRDNATDNGGKNRPHNDYSGAPGSLGTPVPNKTLLKNTADLTATYLGSPVTDSDDATVTADPPAGLLQQVLPQLPERNGGTRLERRYRNLELERHNWRSGAERGQVQDHQRDLQGPQERDVA